MVTTREHEALRAIKVVEPGKKFSWPSVGTIFRYGVAYTLCAVFTALVAIILGGTIAPNQNPFHAWIIGMVILYATGVALATIAGTTSAISNYCYKKTMTTLQKNPPA